MLNSGKIVDKVGWIKGILPTRGGLFLGANVTLHTGPTPLVRYVVPRAIGATGIGVGGWVTYEWLNDD